MKKIYITIAAIVFMVIINIITALWNNGQQAMSNASGPPVGYTSAPGDNSAKNCTFCHTGSSGAFQAGWITSNIPGSGYIPNTTYSITVSIPTQVGKIKFGFQLSPQSPTGVKLGTLISTSTETKLLSTGKYIEHTSSGTNGISNSKAWTFKWTAPTVGTGTVTFYGAFNVANSNSVTAGDIIYTSNLVVTENITLGIGDHNSFNKKITVYPTLVRSDLLVIYSLEKSTQVDMKIIDMNGRTIKQIISEKQSVGDHRLPVNCSDLSNGYYFIHSIIDDQVSVEKFIVSK